MVACILAHEINLPRRRTKSDIVRLQVISTSRQIRYLPLNHTSVPVCAVCESLSSTTWSCSSRSQDSYAIVCAGGT